MKKLVLIILTLAITFVIGRSWFAPSASAQSVESANTALARAERDLRSAVADTQAKAQGIQEHLISGDRTATLPKDVEEFLAATARLEELRKELQQDTRYLAFVSTRALSAFDRERAAIIDPIARHAMTSLRAQAQRQTRARITQARAALNLLSRVLVQGSDVVHAARCVQLADELSVRGEALDERVRAATDEAAEYSNMTTDLLSRLTIAFAE